MLKWIKVLLLAFVLAQVAAAQLADGLYAAFDTTMGGITCRLDYAEAPLTCANFVGLAEGTQRWIDPNGAVKAEPLYDGLIFHRVIEGFMIQGGDPLGTGMGGPGYTFQDQISTNLSHYSSGILSMANSGPDSNGSQFFITLANTDWLDGKHAVFGEVVDGMNVVSNIGVVATDAGNRPLTNVVMNSVHILRVGSEAIAFDPAVQPLPEVMLRPISLSNQTVSVATSNQCELTVHSSTNLQEWSSFDQHYSPVKGADWSIPISASYDAQFFKGTRVFYPQAVVAFSDVENHTLIFSNADNTLIFVPEADEAGTCNINDSPGTISFWEEWTSEPYLGRIVFEASGYIFQFLLVPDGTCSGYNWNGYIWVNIGEYDFSDTPPSP